MVCADEPMESRLDHPGASTASMRSSPPRRRLVHGAENRLVLDRRRHHDSATTASRSAPGAEHCEIAPSVPHDVKQTRRVRRRGRLLREPGPHRVRRAPPARGACSMGFRSRPEERRHRVADLIPNWGRRGVVEVDRRRHRGNIRSMAWACRLRRRVIPLA